MRPQAWRATESHRRSAPNPPPTGESPQRRKWHVARLRRRRNDEVLRHRAPLDLRSSADHGKHVGFDAASKRVVAIGCYLLAQLCGKLPGTSAQLPQSAPSPSCARQTRPTHTMLRVSGISPSIAHLISPVIRWGISRTMSNARGGGGHQKAPPKPDFSGHDAHARVLLEQNRWIRKGSAGESKSRDSVRRDSGGGRADPGHAAAGRSFGRQGRRAQTRPQPGSVGC